MTGEKNILPRSHVRELRLNEDMIIIATITLNRQRQTQVGTIPNSNQMKQFKLIFQLVFRAFI